MDKIFKYLNNVNLGYYRDIEKIYVLGDIHGDLNKFLSFLKSIKIIKSSSFPDDYKKLPSPPLQAPASYYLRFRLLHIHLIS